MKMFDLAAQRESSSPPLVLLLSFAEPLKALALMLASPPEAQVRRRHAAAQPPVSPE